MARQITQKEKIADLERQLVFYKDFLDEYRASAHFWREQFYKQLNEQATQERKTNMPMIVAFDNITPDELNAIIDKINARRGFVDEKAEAARAAAALRTKIAKEELATDAREWRKEYEEFKELVREAKRGKNDLKPTGGWIKIRRFCFELTKEIFDIVEV